MSSRRLGELAKTVRSKNAGVDKITFDIIFPDRQTYEAVRRSRVLTRSRWQIASGFYFDTAGNVLSAARHMMEHVRRNDAIKAVFRKRIPVRRDERFGKPLLCGRNALRRRIVTK